MAGLRHNLRTEFNPPPIKAKLSRGSDAKPTGLSIEDEKVVVGVFFSVHFSAFSFQTAGLPKRQMRADICVSPIGSDVLIADNPHILRVSPLTRG